MNRKEGQKEVENEWKNAKERVNSRGVIEEYKQKEGSYEGVHCTRLHLPGGQGPHVSSIVYILNLLNKQAKCV